MTLSVTWNGLDRDEWERLFAQAGRSALVQSWAWGEAKRSEDGWRPQRALITRDGTPLALAQVLETRKAGLVRIARLNRGPVWLGEPDPGLKLAALAALRRRWHVWNAGVMALAPELPEGTRLPFARGRATPAWGSAWLDLAPEADLLRRQLDGKWRNMLNAAERSGMGIECGADLLPWMLDRHRAQMAEKGFDATPPEMIEALAAQIRSPDDLLVLRASAEGEPVGGILLARHGASATYLLGWSGDEGRRRRAAHTLLWRGVVELKERGTAWFDLGGIDAELTPGIAAFKRGMSGVEYRLAGEFVGF